jgi:hypothetical protein
MPKKVLDIPYLGLYFYILKVSWCRMDAMDRKYKLHNKGREIGNNGRKSI